MLTICERYASIVGWSIGAIDMDQKTPHRSIGTYTLQIRFSREKQIPSYIPTHVHKVIATPTTPRMNTNHTSRLSQINTTPLPHQRQKPSEENSSPSFHHKNHFREGASRNKAINFSTLGTGRGTADTSHNHRSMQRQSTGTK